jgi:hypothetical protein
MLTGFEYLYRHVYTGLAKISRGTSVPGNYIFNEAEFEIVLLRVQELKLGVARIKVWHGQQLIKAVSPNEAFKPNDPNWYFNAFWHFQTTQAGLQYSASFEIPYELILGDFN